MTTGNGAVLTAHALEERLSSRLSDPKTAEALVQILDNIELIALAVTAVDGFLRRSEEIMEAVNEGIKELELLGQGAANLRLVEALPQLFEVTTRLREILDSAEFRALMDSGVFAPKTVGLVGEAGQALVESYEEAQKESVRIGLLGALGALGDPDVQRSLGFLVSFAKRFGRHLPDS